MNKVNIFTTLQNKAKKTTKLNLFVILSLQVIFMPKEFVLDMTIRETICPERTNTTFMGG